MRQKPIAEIQDRLYWFSRQVRSYGVQPTMLVLTFLAILGSVLIGIVLDLLIKSTIVWLDILYCIIIPALVAPFVSYGIFRLVSELEQAKAQLHELATVDGLTGVATRRHFMDLAEWAMEKSRRSGSSVSVLMIDADHFKQINDQQGHAVGDRVLQAIGRKIQYQCRTADLAGRYGGEEFTLLLPSTPSETAQAVAERLRLAVQAEVGPEAELEQPVTVSIGVATSMAGKVSLSRLIDLADGALYQAKHTGRNRVCAADNPEEQ